QEAADAAGVGAAPAGHLVERRDAGGVELLLQLGRDAGDDGEVVALHRRGRRSRRGRRRRRGGGHGGHRRLERVGHRREGGRGGRRRRGGLVAPGWRRGRRRRGHRRAGAAGEGGAPRRQCRGGRRRLGDRGRFAGSFVECRRLLEERRPLGQRYLLVARRL